MQAILHIGVEKTGSTSIQSFLALNRRDFLRQGIAVLDSIGSPNNRYLATYSMDDGRSDESHVALGLTNHKKRHRWKRKLRTELHSEIEALPNNITQVILSSEHCHSRLVSNSEVERLYDLLNPLFDEIKVLVYLRPQDEMAVSLYSTAMKVGYTHKTIIPVDDIDYDYYDYERLLDRWSDVFGEASLIPRVYERYRLEGEDVVQDFCEVCTLRGIWSPDVVITENRSLNPLGQEFLRVFNKHVPGEAYGKPSEMRGPIVQYMEEKCAGKPRMPRRCDAEEFYALFLGSNNRVAQKWFGRDRLFDVSFSDYPEAEPEIEYDFDDAVNIAAYLWLKLMGRDKSVVHLLRNFSRKFRGRIRDIIMHMRFTA